MFVTSEEAGRLVRVGVVAFAVTTLHAAAFQPLQLRNQANRKMTTSMNSIDTLENSNSTLDMAAIGDALKVEHVQASVVAPEWARWLEEIGFVVGERVMLMARGLPGGDPLVVRVGQSTFALRRAEAACIQVSPAFSVAHTENRA